MKKLLILVLVIFLFTGCSVAEKYKSAEEFAKYTWDFQKPIFLENPNLDYETAKLVLQLNAMAVGMDEEEILEYLKELDTYYGKE